MLSCSVKVGSNRIAVQSKATWILQKISYGICLQAVSCLIGKDASFGDGGTIIRATLGKGIAFVKTNSLHFRRSRGVAKKCNVCLAADVSHRACSRARLHGPLQPLQQTVEFANFLVDLQAEAALILPL